MQLLGLYLNDMPKAVSKVLHKGWYPFGAYKIPFASRLVVVDDEMTVPVPTLRHLLVSM